MTETPTMPNPAEALRRAETKLSAYVGVCKGDKELTDTVLPMVREALAALTASPAQDEITHDMVRAATREIAWALEIDNTLGLRATVKAALKAAMKARPVPPDVSGVVEEALTAAIAIRDEYKTKMMNNRSWVEKMAGTDNNAIISDASTEAERNHYGFTAASRICDLLETQLLRLGQKAPIVNGAVEPQPMAQFLSDAAAWFDRRAADSKEDREHWAMVANAENCRKSATLLLSLASERDGLREALKPFAEEADQWHCTVPDEYRSLCTEPGSSTANPGSETAFTIGDLRRARSLTSKAST